MDDDRTQLLRQVRQRLESLRRAGLDRLPIAPEPVRRPAEPVEQLEQEAVAERAEPAVVAATAARPARDATRPPLVGPKPVSLFGDEGFDEPPAPESERAALLEALAAEVAVCTRCPILVAYRTRTVFGEGSPTARLMFVGEGPGADEDRTGRPFVGRAGVLLTDMITKGMGLKREEVYIANAIKSRAPDNRVPLPDELGHCRPYLERQIEIIRPQFLCLLGKTAVLSLLQNDSSVGRLRQRWLRYRGIPTIVTYHPAYLLRNPEAKKDAWEDLQMLMREMGLEPPPKRSG
ncbi:MAG TPA: uracil-DNA glycosylase [Isosphaeraceae bacterium]|nr:uracil-DNA glycosylase [Isosphaeraceae bacterium]